MFQHTNQGPPRPFTDEELSIAWTEFRKDQDYADLDRDVVPLLAMRDRRDWLQSARLASNLSQRLVDGRLGTGSKAFWYFERAEEAGTISLNSLRKCADALDCELVYGLRPKVKKTFGQALWEELLNVVSANQWLLCSLSRNRGSRIAREMIAMIRHPEFRRRRGWRQRPTTGVANWEWRHIWRYQGTSAEHVAAFSKAEELKNKEAIRRHIDEKQKASS